MGGMSVTSAILLIAGVAAETGAHAATPAPVYSSRSESGTDPAPAELAGSASCRDCHERFYELWAPSHHGLAMQPFTAQLARTQLAAQPDDIAIGEYRYHADVATGAGWVRESGPEGERKYRIAHALGGKNVYYFLTPMERGRLQVLPLAFDVRKKEWFDTAASAVRHFPDMADEALDWKEPPYTFNTSCYSCHVSQVSTNYDLESDTYSTVWSEPGINCETCHGPAGEHVRLFTAAPKGSTPEDFRIIRTGQFTVDQTNTLCATCHTKSVSLTATFQPGDRYFDHYDLVGLEHPDFYADGRDLGENYTYTLWLTSPCAKSGRLDCLHCHTSSGRYRFKGDEANNACMPCHQKHVEDPAAHTLHTVDSTGSQCVACHMPKTVFARMERHDHSMRPPTPATTIAFNSPNACNLCHTDQDAAWSDQWVRKWRRRDYQKPVLHRAGLIDAARKRDWRRLREMLAYLASDDRDEVYTASLIRLLEACEDEAKWPAMLKALKDFSPLVRASAARALSEHLTPESVRALLTAAGDNYRLVRVRSAAALAGLRRELLDDQARADLDRAVAEFETAMKSRPDDAPSHHNLGNFYMNRREFGRAAAEFETSARLQPRNIAPLVNASMAYGALRRYDEAEKSLRRALEVEPENLPANLNLALLLGEQGRMREAETALRTVLKTDPESAVAAYNLCVVLAGDRLAEAIEWCRKAANSLPRESKYAYTLAFYLRQAGDVRGAVEVLRELIQRRPVYADASMLLGDIYEGQGRAEEALAVYRQALSDEAVSERDRYRLQVRLEALQSRQVPD